MLNNIYKFILGLFLFFLVNNCAMNVGLVKPNPSFFGIDKNNQFVNYFLNSNIPDETQAETAGIKPLKVKNFRASLANGFDNGLIKIYESVDQNDSIENSKNFIIHIKAVELTMNKVAAITTTNSRTGSYTNYELKIGLRYVVDYIKNGKVIKSSRDEIISKDSFQDIFTAEKVYTNAIEIFVETIGLEAVNL